MIDKAILRIDDLESRLPKFGLDQLAIHFVNGTVLSRASIDDY